MRDLGRLPKAHLHVHLESTIRWPTLREIGADNGVDVPDNESLRFSGFRQFADHNSLVRGCLRRWEDFRRIAVEFCEDEAAQGTRYVEVTFTAAAHGERLGELEMPLDAVLDGLAEGQAAYGIECRVILDHSRRRSIDRAWRTIELATKYSAKGVVGIGAAGDESHPLEPIERIFTAARDVGLHLVHHAGETRGPASIREALGLGRAERIGHGIRIVEDAELVAEVRDRGIALEVCPSSNIALGLADDYASHPLPRLRAEGLVITLNTDIPAIVGTSLTEEYTRVRDTFGYDDADLASFARAGVDASFAPDASKARIHQQIDDWLRSPAG
jgi:adenosine deaminase